jgi:hypothetical protein
LSGRQQARNIGCEKVCLDGILLRTSIIAFPSGSGFPNRNEG